MKKILLVPVVLAALFLAGCKPADDGGEAPVVSSLSFATSVANANAGVFTLVLNQGQTYYAFFAVRDADLDAARAVFTQTSGATTIGPSESILEPQSSESQKYYMVVTPAEKGSWTVTVYVVDKEGNKSNTTSTAVAVL